MECIAWGMGIGYHDRWPSNIVIGVRTNDIRPPNNSSIKVLNVGTRIQNAYNSTKTDMSVDLDHDSREATIATFLSIILTRHE